MGLNLWLDGRSFKRFRPTPNEITSLRDMPLFTDVCLVGKERVAVNAYLYRVAKMANVWMILILVFAILDGKDRYVINLFASMCSYSVLNLIFLFLIFFWISPSCVNGNCTEFNDGNSNYCKCEIGWRGQSCDQCVPHWNCPVQDQTACIGMFCTFKSSHGSNTILSNIKTIFHF